MTRKLNALDQIMDYLSESYDKGGLMLQEEELGENFFDLSTGLARELFQKFTNYNSRLALVIADPGRYNNRFRNWLMSISHIPECAFFLLSKQPGTGSTHKSHRRRQR